MLIEDVSIVYIKNSEAEKMFSVSQSQLSKWRKEGNITSMRGYTKLLDLFEFWKENKEGVDPLEANRTEDEDSSLSIIKKQIQKEILKEKQLANKKMEGDLVEKKEVISAWVARLSDLRSGLLSLKSRLSSKLGMKTEHEVRNIVEKEVDELFNNFSREGKFCK